MKSKDKKNVDLTSLGQKLSGIKSHQDNKLNFELTNMFFLLITILTINLSLYNTSYFNYNFNLLIFIFLFLSRRAIESIYAYFSVRTYSLLNFQSSPLWIFLSIYSLTLTHCIANLFFHYSFSIILTLICPFSAYKLLTTSASAKYIDGWTNCFYHMQQIGLNSLEVIYCAGYLQFKFFPTSGYYFSWPVFTTTLLCCFTCFSALHVGEFMRKRSAELMFFAFDSGTWAKTEEKCLEDWNPDKKYTRGQVVRHKGQYWKAEGKFNSSEPGKYDVQILNLMFRDPIGTMKKVNFLTVFCLGCYTFYMLYLPFHYAQMVCIGMFGVVLVRNIKICRNLSLPNI